MSPGPRLLNGSNRGRTTPRGAHRCRCGPRGSSRGRRYLRTGSPRSLDSHRRPLGVRWRRSCFPSDTSLTRASGAGPGKRLVQPPFDRPSQDLHQPRRQGFQRGPKPLGLLVEQGVILSETGRLARHFQEDGAEVVDDHAPVGPDLLGMLAEPAGAGVREAGRRGPAPLERRGGSRPSIPTSRVAGPRPMPGGRRECPRPNGPRPDRSLRAERAARPAVSAPRPPGSLRGLVPPGGPSAPERPNRASDGAIT